MPALITTHHPLFVPQMGEGLVEVRIAAFFKRPGEAVRRDEPLLEVETDKAILAIESPVDGVVERWDAAEDDVLLVGARLGVLLCQPNQAPDETSAQPAPAPTKREAAPHAAHYQSQPLPSTTTNERHWSKSSSSEAHDTDKPEGWNRNAALSPRVRLFCAGHGISLEEMLAIERADTNQPLRLRDVERWLHARTAQIYEDVPLSPRQKTLAARLTRAHNEVVAASLEVECSWQPLETARERFARQNNAPRLSALDLVAWCVAKAMAAHPKFRSALLSEGTRRQYKGVHLGVAVGLPGDELTTAVLADADKLEFSEFVTTLRASIERARGGHEARGPMQLVITKLSGQNIRHAVPVVVPPAMATLFIGAPYDVPRRGLDDSLCWEKVAQLVLAFDHRLVNGLGAGEFLLDVQRRVHELEKDTFWTT